MVSPPSCASRAAARRHLVGPARQGGDRLGRSLHLRSALVDGTRRDLGDAAAVRGHRLNRARHLLDRCGVLLDRGRQALGHRADLFDRRGHLVDRRRRFFGRGGEVVGVGRRRLGSIATSLRSPPPFRSTADDQAVGVAADALDRGGHLGDRARDFCGGGRHVLHRRASPPESSAVVSSIAAAVSVIDAARLAVLPVTCSIDAATSLIDDTSSSVGGGDRLGLRRGLCERGRRSRSTAPSRVVERAELRIARRSRRRP